jgi:hypothetical protein
MSPPEAPTSRRVWLALLAGAVLTCGLAGGGLLWTASRVTSFFTEPTWGPDAVPKGEVTRTFGVRLPAPPLRYSSRNSGFQDPYLEALLLLPPGEEERFLSENGLRSSGEPGQDTSAAEDQLRTLAPGTGPLEVKALEGLKNLVAGDGGFVALYRFGALMRDGSSTWVYLVAFGT